MLPEAWKHGSASANSSAESPKPEADCQCWRNRAGLAHSGQANKKGLRSFQLQINYKSEMNTHMANSRRQPSHAWRFDSLHNLTMVTALPP